MELDGETVDEDAESGGDYHNSMTSTTNFLLRQAPQEAYWSIETRVDFEPINCSMGGLIVYQDDGNLIEQVQLFYT